MAKISGNFSLSIQNELTDKMAINCTTAVTQRIQELFNKAVEIITPYAKPETVNIIFVRQKAVFYPIPVGLYIKNVIIFDLNQFENHPEELILAVFLEEFAHCYLHITDEKEVSYKVSRIYPKVAFDGNEYHIIKS